MDDPNSALTSAPDVESGLDKSAVAKAVVGLVLVGAGIVFAVQNTSPADVDFLTWSFRLSLILLIVVSAIAGVIVWELVGLVRRRRANRA